MSFQSTRAFSYHETTLPRSNIATACASCPFALLASSLTLFCSLCQLVLRGSSQEQPILLPHYTPSQAGRTRNFNPESNDDSMPTTHTPQVAMHHGITYSYSSIPRRLICFLNLVHHARITRCSFVHSFLFFFIRWSLLSQDASPML